MLGVFRVHATRNIYKFWESGLHDYWWFAEVLHSRSMAILKSFLCMCNTRTGSLISGCYTLTISLVCLVYYLFRYVGHKLVEDSAEYKGIIYVGFVLYGFMIVSSLVIIPGVQLDKRYLLLPWIYIIILMVLYDTGSVALLTTVHMEREKTLHVWEIIWVFFYLFRLAANCYCFTCVVSQYQELSDGRGTYDFLYKPRRRARLRNGSQFDLDTYDLPFGVHLPPYVEEDQTQNNPPSYETIYPEVQINTANNNQESEYVEIEINQSPAVINEHFSRINNSLYPLPTDENGCHGDQENIEEELQNITSSGRLNILQENLNSDLSQQQQQQTFDLHRRPLSCCHGEEIYHLPFCPRHNNYLRLHNHLLHNHHHHHNHDLYHFHRPRSLEGHQRSESESDNPAFKRDSQCYEVTVNIEWI